MTEREIVIVGTGLAGLRAAERLRERGFGGYITMVGDEPGVPYNRPPLSKQMLTGKMRESELGFQTFTHLAVELRAGQRAVALDPEARTVELDTGEEIYYDGLIIATGVSPIRIPDAPQHDDRIAMLRTINDFRHLDQQLKGARSVAIIGGGFIGCEVAASARHRSLAVTLIDRAPVLLNRILGPHLGGSLGDLHRKAGVDVRSGVSVDRWTTSRAGVGLELSDGTGVAADVVLVAVGTKPCVDWLEGTGADISNGVLCDETSHVIGFENVVAAGDVARWPNLRFDYVPRRVEHWINAVEHGRAAADSLLDGHLHARPFRPVPRFWSEQHGVKIQSVGMPTLADRIALIEGDLSQRTFVAACLRGDRVVGALGFNSPRSILDCADVVEAANNSPIEDTGTYPPVVDLPRRRTLHHAGHDHRRALSRGPRATLASYGYGGPTRALNQPPSAFERHGPTSGQEGRLEEVAAEVEQFTHDRRFSAG